MSGWDSEEKRVKTEPKDDAQTWKSGPGTRSNAKQRRQAARASGRSVHYGQPNWVEEDKTLIQRKIDESKRVSWSKVEEVLVSDGPIFDHHTNLADNPSYGGGHTPVDDEPDSYDFLQQPSWDWRLLKVFWDIASEFGAASDHRIAPGAYPFWFKRASSMERMIVLRKPDRSLLPNIRKLRKIVTNLGNKDKMPEYGVDALRWLYGHTWPYGKDADKMGESEGGEDYLDYPPNVSDYRTFLAGAEPAWVAYMMCLREVAIIRASVLSMPTDRRISEGSFLRAVIRRVIKEKEDRLDIEEAEKDYEQLNLWAAPKWVKCCKEFQNEFSREHPSIKISAWQAQQAPKKDGPEEATGAEEGQFGDAAPENAEDGEIQDSDDSTQPNKRRRHDSSASHN